MLCRCSLVAGFLCCARSTFALFVDPYLPNARIAAADGDDRQEGIQSSGDALYVPENATKFSGDFAEAWDEARAERGAQPAEEEAEAATRQGEGNRTVNVVISVRSGDELPRWSRSIMAGEWGEHVSLSVYVKTAGLGPDEERVLESRGRFEMIAIPKFGRSEHAYVWHIARKAPSFASVEIFTKTNDMDSKEHPIDERQVRYMVDVALDGTPYEMVSYPWGLDRRYLQVRCDKAWSNHSLYHEFCEGGRDCVKRKGISCQGSIFTQRYKNGSVGLSMVRNAVTAEKGPADLAWALRQLPQPLPLIHETYGEGMFSVRRNVLGQFSASWYREWKNIMYGDTAPWGYHHDSAMLVLPLLFGRASTTSKQFPAWFVSPSTMDLFDTVDGMRKANPRYTIRRDR
mmetsp:Transcript_109583/g.285622  ORF Transcript_109583/g.285622 Transcript_109583/m.285622 type:complete len:401 (+) Transcript_109583:76-1278(+)